MFDSTSLIWLLLGLGAGVVFGWLATKLRTQKRITVLSTTLEFEQQKNTNLVQTFEALAAKALAQNNQAFFALANEKLGPLQRSLEQFDGKVQEVEKVRAGAYAGITQQISSLLEAQNELRTQTTSLVGALKSPRIRGRWGEIQLKRVVEIAGMLEYCDFSVQQSGNGPLRPDMIVKLPGGRTVVVDAKVPMDGYLLAMEAKDEVTREAKLGEHVRQIRQHMSKLAAKEYWTQFQPAPEFVFMFMPGESFYSVALQTDPSLIEEGVKHRVIIATPVTLIALLLAVEVGWRQQKLTDSAEQISNLGKEIYDRLWTMGEHFGALGSSLYSAVENYNKTLGSLENRVLVSARRFRDLGAGDGAKTIGTIKTVDIMPKTMEAPEFHQ